MHGWAISRRLKSLSGDVLQVSEGSLYPALHKLEQEGWITAEWKQTENNRRAKFYSLTRLGRKQLESEAANWKVLSTAISLIDLLAYVVVVPAMLLVTMLAAYVPARKALRIAPTEALRYE